MAKNTVVLKDYSNNYEERAAYAAITPGMVIEQVSGAETVKAHATQGGNVAPLMVACEDALQGRSIDDDYAAADPVNVWLPKAGDVGNLILVDGETIAIGDLVESNGDGYVRKHVAQAADSDDAITVLPNRIVGKALVAVDLSDSSGAESSGGQGDYSHRLQVQFV